MPYNFPKILADLTYVIGDISQKLPSQGKYVLVEWQRYQDRTTTFRNEVAMPVTIHDVAERAGLSPSTVSRALNKSGYVSEEAQNRIKAAVAELGYQPNWLAKGLKGKSTRLIGLIIPDISNVYYTSVARSVSDVLRSRNLELLLCVTNDDRETDLDYLRVLRDKHVDGIIYVHPANGSNSLMIREMVERGIPIVELNRQRERGLLDSVIADNFQGAYMLTDYLIHKGHQRIGLILGEVDLTTGRDRLAGYKRALRDAELPVDSELVCIGSFTRTFGEAATEDLLNLPNRPTAIFAGSNRILTGALFTLHQRGLRVYDDISLVAFDDAEWLSVWHPPITVVDVAVDEMARLAVDLLERRIQCEEPPRQPITYQLSTFLIERQSCMDITLSHKN